MTISEQLPALQIAIPLLGAPLCVLLRNPRAAWVVTMLCNLACTFVSLALVMATRNGEIIRYALGDWTAPTGIEYYIDIVNAAVLLIVSFISTVVCVYAWNGADKDCLLYTSPSPRDATLSRMPSSA